jgi:LysM repeat protein
MSWSGLGSDWIATIDAAIKNPASGAFDSTIKNELDGYTARLAKTPGFIPFSPSIFKAMALTESGGPTNYAWKTKPMQIGVHGDPGYGVLVKHAENSDIIMSQQLQVDIATKSINEPTLNVRAAIALVLTKAAKFARQSETDSVDKAVHTYTVTKGDSLYEIAQKERTTVQDIETSSGGIGTLIHPGQHLHFHRAHMVTEIVGWQAIDAQFLADRYNGGGDPAYANKITYVLAKLSPSKSQ